MLWGKIDGKRRRRRQRMRWHHWCSGTNRANSARCMAISEAWCAAVHGVLKSRTQLGNWTTANNTLPWIFSYELWTPNLVRSFNYFVSVLCYLYIFHYPRCCSFSRYSLLPCNVLMIFLLLGSVRRNGNCQPKSIQLKKKNSPGCDHVMWIWMNQSRIVNTHIWKPQMMYPHPH